MAQEITSSFAGIQLAPVPEETTAPSAASYSSIQLAPVPEETTAPSAASYSYRDIISTLSSWFGQSGCNHSSISGAGASSSYRFNISAAGAADFGAEELHQGSPLPPIHKVSTSILTKQLASYRESIRSVAWPQWSIRATLPSLSDQSESNYSSGSSALSSNNSGYSSGLGSADATDSRGELTKIAHKMVSDGYTQHMVQEFGDGGDQDRALKNWFVELDVDWVLQIRGGVPWQLQPLPRNMSASELIQKWIRALTIIVNSIIKKELVGPLEYKTSAVARLGKASISAMLVFVEAILDGFKVVYLQPVLQMYVCVSNISYDLSTLHTHSLISSETQSIFTEIGESLVREESRLIQAISTTMTPQKKNTMKVRMSQTIYDYDWSSGMLRGGGVHNNTRLMVEYILLLRKTHASTQNSAQSQNSGKLAGLIQDMINDSNDMLLQKSELCSDPNLRYLFLLNNSYFVAQEVSDPSKRLGVELSSVQHPRLNLIPECKKYMDSYLDVSWGHVVSCILPSNSLGQIKYWKKNSSLAEFQSAFHQTYQTQKFWKVPDPELRSIMREAITKRVIPGYRDYLKEHPELEKHVRGGGKSPEILEKMLGWLFEG